ncbi:MAG: serine--tRNA ligase [Planctomycetota bacterium]|nr:MAG: serine--tRNA ligase [Phycisphaeraceae bacterium]
MIDLKALRNDPDHFRQGAEAKGTAVAIDELLELDAQKRSLLSQMESARAEQKKLAKETGPRMGQLKGAIKKASNDEKPALEQELAILEAQPAALKGKVQEAEAAIAAIEPKLQELLLTIPQPPAPDVVVGPDASANVERRRWSGDFDPEKSFAAQRGFAPKTHLELIEQHDLVDFARGVKMAGSRHYVLKGDGMRLHEAVMRMALEMMTEHHGFTPMSVPVIVREECMVGTGFFPGGREQAYHVAEKERGGGHDLFLTGTGEVGLMGVYADEILDFNQLPITATTRSTCFRREAGAAGRDTAGLYRIHQFDKVEQVVIHAADPEEHRAWHEKMMGFVEGFLQALELPYRLLDCCTGDLGHKNEAMTDIECWMPGRGELDGDGRPSGDWGETHSASRLADFQTRRLNLRYRDAKGTIRYPYALNNTVAASPRVLIPILEMHQQADGRIRIPAALQPYLSGRTMIGN